MQIYAYESPSCILSVSMRHFIGDAAFYLIFDCGMCYNSVWKSIQKRLYFMPVTKSKMKTLGINTVGILLASILRTFSVHSFIVANNFAPGGVTGVASMLQYAIGWNSGIFLFAINIPLVIMAFFLINREFAVKTAIVIVLTSGLLLLFEYLKIPVYADPQNAVLAAIAAGLLGGASLAAVLKFGGSTGGTDILAMIIQKKHVDTNIAWFIFMLDGIVVLASFFVYGMNLTPVLLAFTEMFVSAKTCDLIMRGLKSAQKFEIITDSPEELSKEIIQRLGRGVTMLPAVGMYSHEDKALLVCIVRRRQITEFRKILKNYPDSFAYITATNEVMGRGFNS